MTVTPADDVTSKPLDHELDTWGLTHPGRVRATNQDHFAVASLHKSMDVHLTSVPDLCDQAGARERLAYLMMVADGVGSSEHGEAASRLALASAMEYVAEGLRAYYASEGDAELFTVALQVAATRTHDRVRARAEEEHARSMATTLTLFLGVWPWAFLLQVGDSRYYLFREGALTQVSRDQTMAQDLVDQGILSRVDAARTPLANVLSSSIGGQVSEPVVTRIRNDRKNVHLLCSDGLTKHVSDARIAEVLGAMTSSRQACETLLQEALDGGGSDNVTIVVARILPAGQAGERLASPCG